MNEDLHVIIMNYFERFYPYLRAFEEDGCSLV